MTRGGGEEWGKASAPTPAPARIDGPTLQFVESMIVHAWKRSAATGPPHAGLGADKGMWRMKSRARADIAFCHAHAHTLAYDPRPPPLGPPRPSVHAQCPERVDDPAQDAPADIGAGRWKGGTRQAEIGW